MNIIICGIGGQGVIFISRILAEAMDCSMYAVFDEGQRNGSVLCHIRPRGLAPLTPETATDLLVAMDDLELERNLHLLSPSGKRYCFSNPNTYVLGYLVHCLDVDRQKVEELLRSRPRVSRNLQLLREGVKDATG